MRTIEASAAPQPLLSAATRLATALAVVGFVSVAWLAAGQASHEAVDTTTAMLSRTYVTLPKVEIVARREPAELAAFAASASIGGQRPVRSAL